MTNEDSRVIYAGDIWSDTWGVIGATLGDVDAKARRKCMQMILSV